MFSYLTYMVIEGHIIKSMFLEQKDSTDFAFKSYLQPYLGNVLYAPRDSTITFSPIPCLFFPA